MICAKVREVCFPWAMKCLLVSRTLPGMKRLTPSDSTDRSEDNHTQRLQDDPPIALCGTHHRVLLTLHTKLEVGQGLIHINGEEFILIWGNFRWFRQDGIYLLLTCFSLGGIPPMIPVFNTFPGADHQMERWVFDGAQNLAGDIPWRMDRLRSKFLHGLHEFFFFSRFDFSLNEHFNGHDHPSFIKVRVISTNQW